MKRILFLVIVAGVMVSGGMRPVAAQGDKGAVVQDTLQTEQARITALGKKMPEEKRRRVYAELVKLDNEVARQAKKQGAGGKTVDKNAIRRKVRAPLAKRYKLTMGEVETIYSEGKNNAWR